MSVLNSRITYRSWCDIQEGFSKHWTRSVKNRAWIRVYVRLNHRGMFQGGTTQLICKWRLQNGCHYLESKLRIFVWGVRIVLLYVKCIMMDILMSNTNSAQKKMNFDSSLIFVWYCLLSQFAEDECKRFECKCNIVLMSNLVFVSSIYRKDVVKYTTGDVAFSKHVVSISLLC